MSVRIKFAGGESPEIHTTLAMAIGALRDRWPALVTAGGDDLAGRGVIPDRILVWEDEQSSINDDGQHAVAQITSV